MTSHIEQCCASCGSTKTQDVWKLELNEYQRNNLLWLLNLIGTPYPHAQSVQPFDLANTGDWVSELVTMLRDKDGNMISKESIESVGDIQRAVDNWVEAEAKNL